MTDYVQAKKNYQNNIKNYTHEQLIDELEMCEEKMYAACLLHLLDLGDHYASMIQHIKSRIMFFEINLKHNQN